MKLLFASDSFKGTLSSEQIIRLLTETAEKIFPGCETSGVPIADGGEGTVDAVIAVTKGSLRKVKVHGPLMEETEASYGVFHGDSAIIEMASASGLPMVPTEKRNPLNTTTYGTGELIRDTASSRLQSAEVQRTTVEWAQCVRLEFVSSMWMAQSFLAVAQTLRKLQKSI